MCLTCKKPSGGSGFVAAPLMLRCLKLGWTLRWRSPKLIRSATVSIWRRGILLADTGSSLYPCRFTTTIYTICAASISFVTVQALVFEIGAVSWISTMSPSLYWLVSSCA